MVHKLLVKRHKHKYKEMRPLSLIVSMDNITARMPSGHSPDTDDMLDLPFGWVCSLCISSPDLTDIQNDIIEMIKIHDQPPIEGRISGLPGTVHKDIMCDLCTQAAHASLTPCTE